jgi:hypothetical protein
VALASAMILNSFQAKQTASQCTLLLSIAVRNKRLAEPKNRDKGATFLAPFLCVFALKNRGKNR